MPHGASPTAHHGTITGAEMIGQSEAFLDFQSRLSRAAPVDRPVMLAGERGTGKELAANRLHYLSRRWQGPLITLNCAALNPSLIESELFGHERGAFTGAAARRAGRFERAHEGTMFLDELGIIPMEAQEKILRVVEYGSFERVGGSEPVEVDVRIIAATNADLPAMARDGRFKADLLDRLSFEVLRLPPLRERKEDVEILALHFAARMARELGRREVPEFSAGVMDAMMAHPWPGNVRELKNAVERAVYRSESNVIREMVLDPFGELDTGAPASGDRRLHPPEREEAGHAAWDGELAELLAMPFEQARETLEIRLLQNALKAARFNQRKAAEKLGLSYNQFRGIYRKYREKL